MLCKNCGAPLGEDVKFCAKCGTKVDRNTEPKPEPELEVVPQTELKSESEPEVKPQAEAKPEPEHEVEPQTEAKPEPEHEVEPQTEAKPEPEPEEKPQAEAKPEPEHEVKPQAEVKSAAESENNDPYGVSKVWPEWKVEGEPIGEGAYGVVYKAVRRDSNVNSSAAIKVISIPSKPSELDSIRSEGLDLNATKTYLQEIVNDFVSEIQLMESLKGIENIVSVEDYKVVEKKDEIGWDIYIRMELLTPLNTYISDKKLSEKEVIRLGVDLCSALEKCSKRNVIHRDIKPENIFLNDFGSYKLGDFGVARKLESFTSGLSFKGTPNYMAPEVARHQNYDVRADIYSLGVVLYKLLNKNKLPFVDVNKQILSHSERVVALDRRLAGEQMPAPCEASPAMAELILNACSFNPDRRFASATAMKNALLYIAEGKGAVRTDVIRDNTSKVRSAPTQMNNPDATAGVRKAPENKQNVASFDTPQEDKKGKKKDKKKDKKKKSKLPAIIAAILVVVIIAGAGVLLLPGLLGGAEDETTTTAPATTKATTTQDVSKINQEKVNAIIAEADALFAEKKYEDALKKAEEGLKTYPSATDLQKKRDEYKKARDAQVKDENLAEAAALSQAGDHEGAVKLINSALAASPNDEDYKTAFNTYSDAYVKDVTAKVDECLKADNVFGAKSLLEAASKIVPGNETIKTRTAEMDKYKTVELDALEAINGSFTWDDGTPADPFGSDYSTVKNYTIYHGNECGYAYTNSVEYKIDAQYSILEFNISPYSDYGQNASSFVQVYADNVLRYVSPNITQKSGITRVKVDVSGANYLKIVINKGKNGCIMLSDMALTSIPGYVSEYKSSNVSLATLSTLNGGFTWDSGTPSNIMGDSYSDVANYTIYHGSFDNHTIAYTVSAEYYLAGGYTSFSLDMAPYSDFGSDATTVVKIYVDDVLKYTGTINQRTARFNSGDIDLKNANYLKIVVEKGKSGCFILSDAILKSTNG